MTHDAILALRRICGFLLDEDYVALREEQLRDDEFLGWNSHRIETLKFALKAIKASDELTLEFDKSCEDDELNAVLEPIDNEYLRYCYDMDV